jgi:hypothetical protein
MSKIKRNLIFPFFLKCAELCKDDFWKQVLEDMSYGKPPKNILVYDKNLVLNVGKKKESFSFENLGEKEFIEKVIPFLQNNISLYSCNDVKKRQAIIEQLKKEKEKIKKSKWTQIRKSNPKKIFLLRFVHEKKQEFDLSWNTSTKLYNELFDVLFKQGMSKKVDFEDGKIISVEGLDFYDKSYSFLKLDEQTNKSNKSSKKITKWEAYVKSHLKSVYIMST